jgi:hypothetical protein
MEDVLTLLENEKILISPPCLGVGGKTKVTY